MAEPQTREALLKHVRSDAEDEVLNVIGHLEYLLTDEQKAAINWHPEQSAHLAVMRVIGLMQDAALSDGAREGWQPIETAPKDGNDYVWLWTRREYNHGLPTFTVHEDVVLAMWVKDYEYLQDHRNLTGWLDVRADYPIEGEPRLWAPCSVPASPERTPRAKE